MRDDEREVKLWLTSLLPEGVSRQDIADELDVERKTISTMLNPDAKNFGRGLTMLRYLRHVGALRDAPVESQAGSRLARVEEKVDGIGRTLDDLAAFAREHFPEANREQANGG